MPTYTSSLLPFQLLSVAARSYTIVCGTGRSSGKNRNRVGEQITQEPLFVHQIFTTCSNFPCYLFAVVFPTTLPIFDFFLLLVYPTTCRLQVNSFIMQRTNRNFVLFYDRSLVPAGSCSVWSMGFKLMGRCARTTTSTTTRMPSSIAVTATQPANLKASRESCLSTSSPFRLMKFEPVVIARFSIRAR